MERFARRCRPLLALGLAVGMIGPAAAVQFTTLDPAYSQQIYVGPLVGGPGMAWTPSGHLLTRNGSDILEYSPVASATHQGTAVHPTIATHTITGLFASGYGIANGVDGYLYVNTGNGLQRVDLSTWTVTTPGANLPGSDVTPLPSGGYGITALPDGRIAFVAGSATNEVHVYDPVLQTRTLVYTSSGLLDDIQASPTGEIALAGQVNNELLIITNGGTLLNTIINLAYPDGLAFGWGASVKTLFSNDNQGTITRYDFGTSYSATPTITPIFSGGSYGDLAAVGPDCALYVSQGYNGGYHNSAIFGTHWDNAFTNKEPSIVRIASSRPGECAFAPSGGTVPEPASSGLALAALAALGWRQRRRRHG